MNICFLVHNIKQDNGGGVFSYRVIRGIQERTGCDATLLTTLESGIKNEVPILFFSPLRIFKTFFLVRCAIRTADIVHAFDVFPYGIIAVAASLGLRKKVIITAIGSGSILPFYGMLSHIARWSLRRAVRVTAISKFTRDEILKKVPDISIQVINPGINLKEFADFSSRALPPAVRNAEPYLLSVGTIRWRKGYKRSIRAFAEVSKKFPELSYVITGKKHSEKFFEELQTIIRELGLERKILFLTAIDSRKELLEWYFGARLFCLFSENVNHDVEGFGMVFLEAAASGLPVVGVKNCGVEDAVNEGENGLLVSSRESAEFARAIITILENSALYDSMKKESLRFAEGFEWEEKIDEYEKLYRAIF